MSKKNYTLVIVDLQPSVFNAAKCKLTCRYVRRAARHAMKLDNPIVVVDWIGYPTEQKLHKLVKGYRNYKRVLKDRCDGAYVAAPIIGRRTKRIHICGVNTNACVFETARGLKQALPQTEIVLLKDACNDEFHGKGPLSDFWKEVPNVKMV